ncbi:von Willebrand factor C domain-containing protein 2 [Biomphalaria pfeifferi]|uniref:von Willebrand factor C domain-containing protein 2 n=1 Tax=Biomphalaria pfeifferi TaxID=112525 RepID=A0AAD8BJB0_BIOPF|nr:von Willebrand factor C domain-containing protein 2 [Biomphalaria pfeifferi]
MFVTCQEYSRKHEPSILRIRDTEVVTSPSIVTLYQRHVSKPAYTEGEITDGDCLPCFCYRGSLVCATVQCQSTPCVDYDILPGECCPSCPNGPNCLLPDKGILASGQSTTLNDGRTCTCVAHGHYPTELDCGSRSRHG